MKVLCLLKSNSVWHGWLGNDGLLLTYWRSPDVYAMIARCQNAIPRIRKWSMRPSPLSGSITWAPANIIHYKRQAFQPADFDDAGLRVTFDTDLTYQMYLLHLHETCDRGSSSFLQIKPFWK